MRVKTPTVGEGGTHEPGTRARVGWPRPSPGKVKEARDFLLVELFGDFPFADDARRVHALGSHPT